jgi:RNA polymerase sigma-70 factor (ECF subfamily)
MRGRGPGDADRGGDSVNTELAQLAAIAAGDERAFEAWLAPAEPRLRASLTPFAARVDAEAVLQEALFRVWQTAPRVSPDGRPEALLRFAVRVARNLALTELRRRGREKVTPDPDPPDDAPPPPRHDPAELRHAIRRCREKLPGRPRAAFDLRHAMAGLRDEALAAQLGMTPNTFVQNVRRARLALEECLRAAGFGLEDPR